jgi:ABC-type branched-subunit amino acid transport system ATPase component
MVLGEKINVSIAGLPILRDVSFHLPAGKTTILIGRNGAGKTTTLRAIMGLVQMDSGTITIDGELISQLPAHERAGHGIGYAPEDRRLVPEFSIEDNILLPAWALNLPAAERMRRLESVYDLLPQLRDLRHRPGGGVSGGQGKMVALGRALMVARRALLLDEPFQGLAPALALDYARTLGRLRAVLTDLSIFVTESTPALLKNFADITLQIERGEIVT